MNRLFKGGGKSADEVRATTILHFDHQYNARLIGYSEGACPPQAPSIADDNSAILAPGRQCKLTMSADGVKIVETIGENISEMIERECFRSGYFEISELAWDHSVSGVKFTQGSSSGTTYVVVHVENSLELERDIRLRLKGAARPGARFPAFQYVGMFAGPTKPKPFQRKRPNLTDRAQGKLPPLSSMRHWAMEHYRGSLKPVMTGAKGRIEYALDHIHAGCVAVPLQPMGAQGPGGFANTVAGGGAQLKVDYEGLAVTLGGGVVPVLLLLFREHVQDVHVRDSIHTAESGVGLDVTSPMGRYFLPIPMTQIRYARAAVEFFWNRYRLAGGFPAMVCSTHGRDVLKCHTLQGEKPAPPAPVGNLEVVDLDGNIVKSAPADDGGGPGGPPRRKSLNRAAPRARRTSLLGNRRSSTKPMPSMRPDVVQHWDKVVVHQGWLLKRGGAAKQWLYRYFVLFKTCQGHFLTYYSDVRDCPLFNPKRNERNEIDLCKVTFIRPVSKQEDAPENAFDIVTIERDWTLGAADNEDMQQWLQMITRAVDEDVSIVPDDEIDFRVKALQDPTRTLSRNDYNTALRVGCMGVSVNSARSGAHDGLHENHFWCYTDFYKWSTIQQGQKLALLLNVFMTTDFDQKHEFIFRTPLAPQLATAIEYYIEKFMSIMHMNREDEAPEPEPEATAAASPEAAPAVAPTLGAGADDVLADNGSHNLLDGVWADGEGDAAAEAAAVQQSSLSGDDLLNFASVGSATPGVVNGGMNSTSLLDDLGIMAAPSAPAPAPMAAPAPAPAPAAEVDLFGSQMAAPAPAATAATNGFFVDESATFGLAEPVMAVNGNGAGGAPVGLTPAALENLRLALVKQAVFKEGPLLSDFQFPLAVDAKVEYRGSQARIILTFRNQGQTSLSGLTGTLAGGDPQDALRTNQPAINPSDVLPTQAATYVLLSECMKPFTIAPTLAVSFHAGGQAYAMELPLPVFVTGFVESVDMTLPDFQSRWGSMAGAGQACQAVVSPAAGTRASASAILSLFARAKEFSSCSDASANATGVVSQCFAGTLRTGKEANGRKISAGCLVVVETNEAAGVYRLNVRSVHQSVSAAIFEDLKVQIEYAANF